MLDNGFVLFLVVFYSQNKKGAIQEIEENIYPILVL